MTTSYTYFLDLAKEAEPPVDGILSRSVDQDERATIAIVGRPS